MPFSVQKEKFQVGFQVCTRLFFFVGAATAPFFNDQELFSALIIAVPAHYLRKKSIILLIQKSILLFSKV